MQKNKIIQNTSDIRPVENGGFFVAQDISEDVEKGTGIGSDVQTQESINNKDVGIRHEKNQMDGMVTEEGQRFKTLIASVPSAELSDGEVSGDNNFEDSFLAQVEERRQKTSSDMTSINEQEVIERPSEEAAKVVNNFQSEQKKLDERIEKLSDRSVEDVEVEPLERPREINLGMVQTRDSGVLSKGVIAENNDEVGDVAENISRMGYKENFNFKAGDDELGEVNEQFHEDSLRNDVAIGSIDYGTHSGLNQIQNDKSFLREDTIRNIEQEDGVIKKDNSIDRKIGNFLNQDIDPVGRETWRGEETDYSQNSQEDIKKKRRFLPSIIGERGLSISPFVTGILATSLVIMVAGFASFGFQAKGDIEVRGARAVNYIKEAKIDLQNKNFELATTNLVSAKQEFKEAQDQIDKLGGRSLDIFAHIPFLSKISSGKNVVALGDGLTDAVVQLSNVSELLIGMGNPLDLENESRSSLTDIFVKIQENVNLSKESLEKAEVASAKIKVSDLPEEHREKIGFIKDFLPLVNDSLDEFDRYAEIFLELFGHNGPRKYLIVFQNNQEMRATGGFIGSYGLLETSQGRIDRLKIEGIYNPDGQLKVDVVPPRPIQKISAGWSTHDANWFPDFPKSAEKISWFYEKTGGPTVDGVIAVTPVLLQKMLEITGPIEMTEYDKIITSKNFIKEIQQEVEVDYDKEENAPKKILADLTPILFAKFFDLNDPKQAGGVIKILLDALREKHVLINFSNSKVQGIVSDQGWAGEVLKTEKDYLMVINSNINGYKTDGVIEEQIKHQAEIKADGSVVDTVTIIRKHNGGNTEYEWWNQVNANYMRLYVPEGSKLISAEGHTREMNDERLNYDKLGFQVDADVKAEENYMEIDEESGTRIYKEANKTVFANWVYVSPQERVTVVYKYLLPFKVDVTSGNDNRYSLLMQKQSGAVNSTIKSEIEFPFAWSTTWVEPKNLKLDKQEGKLLFRHELNTDQFIGAVFRR